MSVGLTQAAALFKDLFRGRAPGQLVIQFTDHCNARCPQCGMNISNRFPRSRLSEDDIKRILDAAVARGVRVVSFTGGEPLLFLDDLVRYIGYAVEAGIDFIRTGTNGFLFAQNGSQGDDSRAARIADKLAGTGLRNFWISLDSADTDVHESMRGFPGVVRGIERALPHFHRAGLYPSVNLGVNRNLDPSRTPRLQAVSNPDAPDRLPALKEEVKSAFDRYFRFAVDLGFTMVNACYPMSLPEDAGADGLEAVYAAASTDRVVRFDRDEKAVLFEALGEAVAENRSRIRIFSPRSSLHALARWYGGEDFKPYGCRGGSDFLFIDSGDGNTYPCGYRGTENLGRYWDLGPTPTNGSSECLQCDWECFRDPSELIGPVLEGRRHPLTLLGRWRKDREYFRLWRQDLAYYRACGFFDGRKPPSYRRLAAFGANGAAGHSPVSGS